jgi:hypothetical protein
MQTVIEKDGRFFMFVCGILKIAEGHCRVPAVSFLQG